MARLAEYSSTAGSSTTCLNISEAENRIRQLTSIDFETFDVHNDQEPILNAR